MATFSPRISPWSHVRLHDRYAHLVWILAGWAIGFAVSAVSSSILELSRPWFVLVYLVIAGPFLAAYVRWSGLDIGALVRHPWQWGIAAAVVVGAFMLWAVQGMDASPRPDGMRLVFDLVWLGLVYGTLDGLFLSVLPIVAVWNAFPERATTVRGKFALGVIALAASLIVTTTYHLGFLEFRNADIRSPLIANGLFTLGSLLAMNPLTAVVGHIVLHVASVLHGADTTVSLPPHY